MMQLFVVLATFIHIYIFLLESFLWGSPKVNQIFGVTTAQAESNRLFAFNQGFYNLFLAIASAIGLVLRFLGEQIVSDTLIVYASCSMFGAATVLFYSQPKLIRAFLIQGMCPLLALTFWFLKF